jgi:6-hydroxycyclohex-1-ene-1-carbonyl-CoA dehydrogenase
MVLEERAELPGPGQVVVEVAGCGLCHTDLGFYYDGVPTRHPFPLTLGHEVSGTVVEAGEAAGDWVGREVIVPAVIPCGECPACKAGRGPVCPHQIFPGSDVHGGFATHLVVPARGLCPVPDLGGRDIELPDLSVIADAVSTPYAAIHRSGLSEGDLAVFIGAGGVGGFGVQLAAAHGAHVVAIDVDEGRLETMAQHGADLTVPARPDGFKELRNAVRQFAKSHGVPTWRQKIFETSGMSNLMAFDATAEGNWGCAPEHYPAIVELVLAGKVALKPFVERRPLSSINETFADVHERRVSRRVILIPER